MLYYTKVTNSFPDFKLSIIFSCPKFYCVDAKSYHYIIKLLFLRDVVRLFLKQAPKRRRLELFKEWQKTALKVFIIPTKKCGRFQCKYALLPLCEPLHRKRGYRKAVAKFWLYLAVSTGYVVSTKGFYYGDEDRALFVSYRLASAPNLFYWF